MYECVVFSVILQVKYFGVIVLWCHRSLVYHSLVYYSLVYYSLVHHSMESFPIVIDNTLLLSPFIMITIWSHHDLFVQNWFCLVVSYHLFILDDQKLIIRSLINLLIVLIPNNIIKRGYLTCKFDHITLTEVISSVVVISSVEVVNPVVVVVVVKYWSIYSNFFHIESCYRVFTHCITLSLRTLLLAKVS